MKQEDKFWELSTGKIFNELSAEEESEFEQLLKDKTIADLAHKTEQVHSKIKGGKPLLKFSGNRSWDNVSKHLRTKKIHLAKEILKYAALIILALISGVLLKTNKAPQPTPVVYAEIKIPLGQMSEITLYDGTRVWLNSGTTLKYPNNFGQESRNVILDGEAFFKVQHSNIPFIVKLKKSEIEVLGTSFNVISYAEENASQVTLIEGSVQINNLSGKEMAKIEPSEQINIPDDLKELTIKKVSTEFYSSWTDGKIEFDEERLADIASRLERWYNVDIEFSDKSTEDLRFSGTILKNKPFDQIIKAIGLLLPVEIKYQNKLGEKDKITITKIDKPM